MVFHMFEKVIKLAKLPNIGPTEVPHQSDIATKSELEAQNSRNMDPTQCQDRLKIDPNDTKSPGHWL